MRDPHLEHVCRISAWLSFSDILKGVKQFDLVDPVVEDRSSRAKPGRYAVSWNGGPMPSVAPPVDGYTPIEKVSPHTQQYEFRKHTVPMLCHCKEGW